MITVNTVLDKFPEVGCSFGHVICLLSVNSYVLSECRTGKLAIFLTSFSAFVIAAFSASEQYSVIVSLRSKDRYS